MTSPSCPNEACRQSIASPAKVVRHGFFRVRCGRRRRSRCRDCGRTFSARTNTPCFGLRCSSRVFERVAPMSVEGMSCAAIARVEGVAWHTADRWLTKAAELAQRFNERHIHGIPLVELQADKLRTFSPCKVKSTWVSRAWKCAHDCGLQRSSGGAATPIRKPCSVIHSVAAKLLEHH